MGDRATILLRDIQSGALDGSTSVSDLLRKCVALGGAAGSRRLVDWASSELSGYKGGDELPSYRRVPAPLMIDGISGWTQVRRQTISPSALPDFAHGVVREEVQFFQGVGTIEELVAREQDDSIMMSPPGSADLVSYWNRERKSDVQQIHRLYWSVAKGEVAGIMHQIRNRLVQLIAEFEIEYETAASTGQAVDRAVQITMGDGGSVAVVSSDRGSTNKVKVQRYSSPLDGPKWTMGRKIGAAAVGCAGIASAIFTYMALPR